MISPICNGLRAKFPHRNIYFHCFTEFYGANLVPTRPSSVGRVGENPGNKVAAKQHQNSLFWTPTYAPALSTRHDWSSLL